MLIPWRPVQLCGLLDLYETVIDGFQTTHVSIELIIQDGPFKLGETLGPCTLDKGLS